MRRRDFMGALAAAGLPAAGSAQDARKIYRLAVLAQSSPSVEAVRSIVVPELAKHGFVEGVNLVVDLHAGADDELPRLAREIVDRAPDAILTIASQPTRAARGRTSTIPIVLFGGEDAIAAPAGDHCGDLTRCARVEARECHHTGGFLVCLRLRRVRAASSRS